MLTPVAGQLLPPRTAIGWFFDRVDLIGFTCARLPWQPRGVGIFSFALEARKINSPIAAASAYISCHSGGDYSASAMIEKTIALPRRDQRCGPSGNFADLARVDRAARPREGRAGRLLPPNRARPCSAGHFPRC